MRGNRAHSLFRSGVVHALALIALAGLGAPAFAVDDNALLRVVLKNVGGIDEFRELGERAHRLQLRAWLFGGSAAAVAHHARRQLETSSATVPSFADVFRWNQDVDVVVDSLDHTLPEAEVLDRARRLEEEVQQLFPHIPGERARWEVRLLRTKRGDKAPLLGDPDIWQQHNDSGSIGLLEITEPPEMHQHVRDGNGWYNATSLFWTDAAAGRITFLPSTAHHTTERSVDGLNPSVFSLIRFLTKKHQYGLTTTDPSMQAIQGLVAELRDQLARGSFPSNGYVARWLHHNVRKMIANAQDVATLWAELDALKLRPLLAQIGGDASRVDSVAWWLAKEPLLPKPLGESAAPSHATARSLGIDRVTHITSDLNAFEAIRRSTLVPNVFKSRGGQPGERALFGDGVYVTRGVVEPERGAFAIEMRLDPDAVENIDFELLEKPENAILILNRSALHLVEIAPGGDPMQFFGELVGRHGSDTANFGILAQWRRVVNSRFQLERQDNRDQILQWVDTALDGPLDDSQHLLREWFLLPASTRYPALLRKLVKRIGEPAATGLIIQAMRTPHWRRSELAYDGVFALLNAPVGYFEGRELESAVASQVLKQPDAWGTPWFESAVFRLVMLHSTEHQLLDGVFLAPGFTESPNAARVVKRFIDFANDRVAVAHAFAQSSPWSLHPDAIGIASTFAKDPPALAPLFGTPRWQRTFVSAGADTRSFGRLRHWLLHHAEKNTRVNGLYLPESCLRELLDAAAINN